MSYHPEKLNLTPEQTLEFDFFPKFSLLDMTKLYVYQGETAMLQPERIRALASSPISEDFKSKFPDAYSMLGDNTDEYDGFVTPEGEAIEDVIAEDPLINLIIAESRRLKEGEISKVGVTTVNESLKSDLFTTLMVRRSVLAYLIKRDGRSPISIDEMVPDDLSEIDIATDITNVSSRELMAKLNDHIRRAKAAEDIKNLGLAG